MEMPPDMPSLDKNRFT